MSVITSIPKAFPDVNSCIVYTFDKRFVPYFSVALQSLIDQASGKKEMSFASILICRQRVKSSFADSALRIFHYVLST